MWVSVWQPEKIGQPCEDTAHQGTKVSIPQYSGIMLDSHVNLKPCYQFCHLPFRYCCIRRGCNWPGSNSGHRLKQHMATAHGGPRATCKHCFNPLSYDNMARHLKKCQERNAVKEEKMMLCPYCDMRFITGNCQIYSGIKYPSKALLNCPLLSCRCCLLQSHLQRPP